mmetsp:Transcript_86912/g.241919  ORF Transcript_86912/g.241919 Transcript_86912/m.241919 type:complete len:239 (-) Transcript_86912:197-913(-)
MLHLQRGYANIHRRRLLVLLLLAGLPKGPVELRGLKHRLQRRGRGAWRHLEPLVLQGLLSGAPLPGRPVQHLDGEARRLCGDDIGELRRGLVPDLRREAGGRRAQADAELHLLARPDLRHVGEVPVDHKVQDHTEGPHVHLAVVVQAFDHLGRHERRRAADPAQLVPVGGGGYLRKTEVAQLDHATLALARTHVVLRLEVAVDDAHVVDHHQALEHALHEGPVHVLGDVVEALQRGQQ